MDLVGAQLLSVVLTVVPRVSSFCLLDSFLYLLKLCLKLTLLVSIISEISEALELAHGRPPLSHLPPSKSMMLKITKRFRFSDFDKYRKGNGKKFSKAFKDMVASCLDQDPSKRPTADKLLKHPFFKNCKGTDFSVRNVLQGLPRCGEKV
ncbi:unnamed protein product [Sphenostylis stenocarpa]|uniref:Protein kinase domain-containing protein n=1 Tax=Sphenostylis stenocarpa TaxID=92480 RepID=A0AA86S921_9FABA|nr:unnamed protein product [Sphenostylis stenocarpa]